MQNLNTYKGKDVVVTTLIKTLQVTFFVMYICKYEKKWLCIFEFSNLSDALYHSYYKEKVFVLVVFLMMSFRLIVSVDTLSGFIQIFWTVSPVPLIHEH